MGQANTRFGLVRYELGQAEHKPIVDMTQHDRRGTLIGHGSGIENILLFGTIVTQAWRVGSCVAHFITKNIPKYIEIISEAQDESAP